MSRSKSTYPTPSFLHMSLTHVTLPGNLYKRWGVVCATLKRVEAENRTDSFPVSLSSTSVHVHPSLFIYLSIDHCPFNHSPYTLSVRMPPPLILRTKQMPSRPQDDVDNSKPLLRATPPPPPLSQVVFSPRLQHSPIDANQISSSITDDDPRGRPCAQESLQDLAGPLRAR